MFSAAIRVINFVAVRHVRFRLEHANVYENPANPSVEPKIPFGFCRRRAIPETFADRRILFYNTYATTAAVAARARKTLRGLKHRRSGNVDNV